MKTIGYIRVSTDRQELGPEAQRAMIQQTSEDPAIIWYEEAISGAKELSKRIELMSAIAALEKGDCLIVAKLDRLARDLYTQMLIEHMIDRQGARLVSCAGEGTGSDDAQSRFMRQVLGAVAELERAMIRARTKAAIAVKKARGERIGGVPYGYHADGNKIIQHAPEQDVISQIMRWKESGKSCQGICDELNARGVQREEESGI